MNEKEKLIASSMLDEYSDRLGNDGCNDWDFPPGWTMAEKQVFVKEYHEWNGDPEEYDEKEDPYISNHCVALFLAHKLNT